MTDYDAWKSGWNEEEIILAEDDEEEICDDWDDSDYDSYLEAQEHLT